MVTVALVREQESYKQALPATINLIQTLYEVKNNCCPFERIFRVKKNGVFLFGISFLVLEIFTFLCYANGTVMTS